MDLLSNVLRAATLGAVLLAAPGAEARQLRCDSNNGSGNLIETWEAEESGESIDLSIIAADGGTEFYNSDLSSVVWFNGTRDRDASWYQFTILRSGNPYLVVVDWGKSRIVLAAYGDFTQRIYPSYADNCTRLD
jgi:hypothetical protein